MKNIITGLRGLVVGATMLVPGVSGGSMAIILGIYNELISSVSSFMKHKRKSFFFLLIFALGALVGMLLFATPLSHLISLYPKPMLYFFIGVVAGGIPLIFKESQVKKFTPKVPLYIGIGVLCVVALSLIPKGAFSTEMEPGLFSFSMLTLAGLIAAVALVLPGISVSYLLLLLGLYDETIKAMSELYFPFLLPLGIGLLLGIILTTKMLEHAMNTHKRPTYLIILGFVIGSVAEIFPGVPKGTELLVCILMLAAGFLIVRLISWRELKAAISSLSK